MNHEKHRCNVKQVAFCIIWLFVLGLTMYRVIDWLLHYKLLANSMLLNIDKAASVPFPDVTLCNLNAARGTVLIGQQSNTSLHVYEDFVDLINAKFVGNNSYSNFLSPAQSFSSPSALFFHSSASSSANNVKNKNQKRVITDLHYTNLLDKGHHLLKSMLKSCKFGNKICTWKNFRKRITANGVCFTLHPPPDIPQYSQLELVLDPEEHEYVIPNKGFVGIRVMLHHPAKSLWTSFQDGVNVGQKFQTIIRSAGYDQVTCSASSDSQNTTSICIETCIQRFILNQCFCQLTGTNNICSVRDLAHCALDISELYSTFKFASCKCPTPCHTTEYTVLSVTQALKSTLYVQLNALKEGIATNNKSLTIIQTADSIQKWAFLREANITAFQILDHMTQAILKLYSSTCDATSIINRMSNNWNICLRNRLDLTSSCNITTNTFAKEMGSLMHHKTMLERRFKKSFIISKDNIVHSNIHLQLVQKFLSGEKVLKPMRFDKFISVISMFQVQIIQTTNIDDCLGKTFISVFRDLSHSLKSQLSTGKVLFERISDQFREVSIANEDIRKLFLENTQSGEYENGGDVNSGEHQNGDEGFVEHSAGENQVDTTNDVAGDKYKLKSLASSVNRRFTSYVTLTIMMSESQNHRMHLLSMQTIINPVSSLVGVILSSLSGGFLLMLAVKACLGKRHIETVKPSVESSLPSCIQNRKDVTAFPANITIHEDLQSWSCNNKEFGTTSIEFDSPLTSFGVL